ncbi:hypothetical protein Tco_0844508 [Tanacetum coccineum]
MVKGDYKFGMEIPDTMISDAIKKLAGYKLYMAKKVESKNAKIVDKPEEEHVSPVKSGRGKGFMCYGNQVANVPTSLKKDDVLRKTRSQIIVEETVVGQKLKGLVVDDPAVQSLLDLQKGSKANRLESLKQKKQAVAGKGLSVNIDDPNITMEEYVKLEDKKARRRGKLYNWETATYGKIWYDEDVHDLRSVETELPAIVFNDSLTFEETPSSEPTVSPLNDSKIDFRISFDKSDDEDYTVIYDKNSFSYKIISVNDLKTDSKNDNDKVNMPSFPSPEPTFSYFDDLDFFKDFKNEFPAIIYNDALTSKSDSLTEPTISRALIHKNREDFKHEGQRIRPTIGDFGGNCASNQSLFNYGRIEEREEKKKED